jgi:hypothetical protein
LDEYDTLIDDYPYGVYNSQVRGLWLLKERKVYAFTATSSLSYERLISNCIVKPKALIFQSEYEMINGVSPISTPIIQNCGSPEKVLVTLKEDITHYHEIKPIIVIHDQHQSEDIVKMLKGLNFRYFSGIEYQTLLEIRTLEYGILLMLAGESRGIDTRFQSDSIVLIAATMKSDH